MEKKEFIYDGSHLGREEKECLYKYTNGISLWVVFDNKNKNHSCEIRVYDEVIEEFDKIAKGELFIRGMAKYAQKMGHMFVEVDSENEPANVDKLRNEVMKLRKEKEKAQKLSEKLIKGVMKNKGLEAEKNIVKILENNIQEL